jgi:hypothetical protein
MALKDAIASAKARVGNLNTSIQEHRNRKQEYTSFLSHQSLGNAPFVLFFLPPANAPLFLASYLISILYLYGFTNLLGEQSLFLVNWFCKIDSDKN